MLLPKEKRYKAFTLIEMLIVILILVILGSLSLASYQRMQVVMRTNEYINSLEQDIRRIQRDAMLLDRQQGEYWPFGIGIDFTEMNKDGGSGYYRVFKWCSPYAEYGNRRTTSSVPGYAHLLLGSNPNLPENKGDGTACYDNFERRLYLPRRYLDLKPPKSEITVTTRARGLSEVKESTLGYVLFESVTGKAFFYDKQRKLINYKFIGDEVELVPNISDLVITIKPLRGGVTRTLTVQHLSGMMEIGVK
ncbi:MAG: prepilin-type N-terminal cleavage/methylation domain-containing protein [Candidatus Dojkabacteria bacterium]|jgi:prepilin-type N-terminal cleavage/methylation domain-containing protein